MCRSLQYKVNKSSSVISRAFKREKQQPDMYVYIHIENYRKTAKFNESSGHTYWWLNLNTPQRFQYVFFFLLFRYFEFHSKVFIIHFGREKAHSQQPRMWFTGQRFGHLLCNLNVILDIYNSEHFTTFYLYRPSMLIEMDFSLLLLFSFDFCIICSE